MIDNKKENPALNEVAKQFNDALLDEQKKEIDRLRQIIRKKDRKISELKKESKKHLKDKIKVFNENQDLLAQLESVEKASNSEELAKKDELIAKLRMYLKEDDEVKTLFTEAILDWDDERDKFKKAISDKDAALFNAKNEIRELRQRVADNAVAKVNMQALHSAERALIYKEKEFKKNLEDKDAVLSDVAEELRLSKIREDNLTEVCKKYLKEIEDLKNKVGYAERRMNEAYASCHEMRKKIRLRDIVIEGLKEDLSDSKKSIKDCQKEIEDLKKKKVNLGIASVNAVDLYIDSVTRAELDGLLLDFWEKDSKGITAIYQLKNGKRHKLRLDFTGDEVTFSRSDPDKNNGPRYKITFDWGTWEKYLLSM